jgi:uncharacterized protein (DUF58 family)
MQPAEILKKLRRIELRSTRMVDQGLGGSYHSLFKGKGIEFAEVREYQPGDDVRSIDWNVTARTGAPHVKVFTEERELTVMLVVDASASLRVGSRERSKAALAAELAALLAFSAIRNNDRVGLMMATEAVEEYVPPRKGRSHVMRVIRDVLNVRPSGRGTGLAAALRRFHNLHRRRAVVFILSDFLLPNRAETALVMRTLARRHDMVALRISDPLEHEIPPAGLVEWMDPETGESALVDCSSRSFQREWRRAVQAEEAEITAMFGMAQMDFLELRTDEAYWLSLARFMRERCERRRWRAA